MRVREFNRSDLKAVLEINKACHSKPQPDEQLMEIIDKGDTWVAEVDGKIVGMLIAIYREGPYVFNTAVLPEYRNQGIASALFKQFETYFKPDGFYYLYVDSNNPAQKLYFDLGYRIINIKKDFYGKGENALIMVKYVG
jgi:ribosomal protein S18 acetylase RimI-like enzyme